MNTCFINVSNHPSAKWSSSQYDAAVKYGEIVDYPFPSINPEWDDVQVSSLANDYVNRIISEKNALKDKNLVFHIMGEMNFTYALVSKLSNLGYVCLASTTQRIVKEKGDNAKEVVFEFVRFRKYVV